MSNSESRKVRENREVRDDDLASVVVASWHKTTGGSGRQFLNDLINGNLGAAIKDLLQK